MKNAAVQKVPAVQISALRAAKVMEIPVCWVNKIQLNPIY